MVALQTTWSWLPAIYLFLGGLSGGAFLTVSILRLVFPGRYDRIVMRGSWVAVAALAVGLLALIAEVEKPFSAILLPMAFNNFGSIMTIGAWLLLVTFVVFAVSALLSIEKFGRSREGISRILAIIGIPLSVAVAVYTGILLGAAPAIPLWGTWLLPVLFTVSAFDTGVASIAIIAALEKGEGIDALKALLEKATVVLVVLELVVIAAFIMTMQGAGADEARSIGLLLDGPLTLPFWLLVIVVGLIGPLVAALTQIFAAKKGGHDGAVARVVPIAGAVCALIGGFALRYIILSAGLHAALVSPDMVQAAAGILMYL